MAMTRRGLAGAAAIPAALIGTAQAQPAQAVESTFERVNRTKVLRIAALPGELPYFMKDLASGEWKGAAIEFARDIAKVFDAKLEYIESTYGGSVLDLQSNKIDLAFALNPTPQRALVIGFTRPFFIHPFGCLAKKDMDPKTWDDVNKPDIRIACDLGSLHEVSARRFAPKAQITAYKSRDDATLAFQSGRADVFVLATILGLSTVARNRALGRFHLLQHPLVALPSALGVRREPDTRFVEVINAWIDYNRGIGQIRDWLLAGLALNGVQPDDIPPEVTF
ncbi:MAG TPA: transporter substrate-binding domain-containing protein [Acetobacteraceae bacterium]|nr:transporter substrate-binding domain-containing protein [Acetobacteraceae bacterium]